ncbi:MAG: hypothetical protein ACTSW3_06155 [Promethearchaeota archaeon]
MKQKYIILLTILITTIVVIGGLFLFQYELKKNQTNWEEGYNYGKLEGLLYTQQTGNIVILDNGNLTEVTIGQVCNNLNQQQVIG